MPVTKVYIPSRLSNAPAILQESMSIVFEGLDKFTVTYLDDIAIYSRILDEHLVHIQEVFDRLN